MWPLPRPVQTCSLGYPLAPVLAPQDLFKLVSLHIRSMWETICDAWACWSGWNFGPNSTEYPYSEIQFQNIPPPRNENCQRSWHFDFSVSEYPPKLKIVRDLGTLTFQFQNIPPPKNWKLSEILALWLFSFRISPPKTENCQRSWHFDFSVSEYPPETENCQRSWHFDFSVSESPQKWTLSEILALWLFSFRIPPPPRKLKFRQILAI